MPGLEPGIHVFNGSTEQKDVDGRVKPGHDEAETVKQNFSAGVSDRPPAVRLQ